MHLVIPMKVIYLLKTMAGDKIFYLEVNYFEETRTAGTGWESGKIENSR